MTPIERRHAATEATLAKYRDQPFKWGRYDCARVIAHQAKKLGHKVSLAKAGSYSSALGAKRALAKVGYATLSEALDAHLPRIAPASALLGDIIEIEGDGRSEEHTSELQSLMRISYAVFCLQKKT